MGRDSFIPSSLSPLRSSFLSLLISFFFFSPSYHLCSSQVSTNSNGLLLSMTKTGCPSGMREERGRRGGREVEERWKSGEEREGRAEKGERGSTNIENE